MGVRPRKGPLFCALKSGRSGENTYSIVARWNNWFITEHCSMTKYFLDRITEEPPSCNTGVRILGYRVEKVACGVDWITATCTGRGKLEIWPDADYIKGAERWTNEIEVEPFVMQGYKGWKMPLISYGERDDGSLRQATGGAALPYVEFAVKHTIPIRPSRLDLCIDLTIRGDPTEFVNAFATADARRIGSGTPPKKSLINTYGNGNTLYLGAPSSSTRLRVYDKWRERKRSDDWYNVVRIELQTRKDVAAHVYNRMLDSQDVRGTALNYCCAQIERWGYSEFGALAGATEAPYRVEVDPTNVHRRLRWLEEQVRPALRQLEKAGYGEQAFDILFPGMVK